MIITYDIHMRILLDYVTQGDDAGGEWGQDTSQTRSRRVAIFKYDIT